ncbi:MAG: hypothetical protein AMJ55_12105 [Gammaproteobacteria bacterium SG8_15]|nr:MAG: hypothetical protein AMJ55_12105 [Gammaproteobacteria bacterium SG8_15]
MITLDRLGQYKPLAMAAMNKLASQLSHALGLQVALVLETQIDDRLLERMTQLENEIFSVEDNVYSKDDIRECLAEEDSMLLLLIIDDRIEGYTFGYDDDIDNPTVKDTEYFIDTAVVSLQYEHKGIGAAIAGIILLLLYLMGYRNIGILTEEKDKTGRQLVKFYQRLGFEEVETTEEQGCAMKITLTDQLVKNTCSRLGITFPASELTTSAKGNTTGNE